MSRKRYMRKGRKRMEPDREEVLEKLKSYYGTAAVNGFSAALPELYELDSLDEDELKELAEGLGI